MNNIFTRIKRWLAEPVLAIDTPEPSLSPRDWSDLPAFHPTEAAPQRATAPGAIQAKVGANSERPGHRMAA